MNVIHFTSVVRLSMKMIYISVYMVRAILIIHVRHIALKIGTNDLCIIGVILSMTLSNIRQTHLGEIIQLHPIGMIFKIQLKLLQPLTSLSWIAL